MEEQMEEWVTTQNSHKEKINWVDEWIKKFWYVYTMEYYSALKKNIWVSPNEADEPKACYTEWSKSEREKQISYINTYLEKWYWWTYLQGSNRDTDIENELVDTEGQGGLEWIEKVALTYIHYHV